MTPELEKQIYAASPTFFGEKDLDMTQTCMCWGIECGDGWFRPILELVKGVNVLNGILAPMGFAIVCSQMKSKWADFTCYWNIKSTNEESGESENEGRDGKDDELMDTVYHLMESLVGQTEEECSKICEICGHRGLFDDDVVRCGSWITVKCHKCAQERQRQDGVIRSFHEGFDFLSPFCDNEGIAVDGKGYRTFLGAYYGTLRPEYSNLFEGMSHARDVQECAVGLGLPETTDRAVEVMEKVLRCKYFGESYLSKSLLKDLASVAGLKIEWRNRSHEDFWGMCVCDECSGKEHHNHYGKILMRLAGEASEKMPQEKSASEK